MNLSLVKSDTFGQVQCDFYQNEQSDILMTREQIGSALEYADPNGAIEVIHRRNRDRLDSFSTSVRLTGVEGSREVTRDITIYTAKGIYEICRFSRQTKADAFMDWVWDVIETIRKTGMYAMENVAVKQYMSMTDEDRAILYFQQMKEKKELEQQKALMAPKAELFDTFMSAENSQTISNVAKTLNTGRNRLFALLRHKRILMEDNLPYQRFVDAGYFTVKQIPIQMGTTVVDKPTTFVTPKGIAYIARLITTEEVAMPC